METFKCGKEACREFKAVPPLGKVMAIVFYDKKNVFLVHFLKWTQLYTVQKLEGVLVAVTSRGPGLLTKGLSLLHILGTSCSIFYGRFWTIRSQSRSAIKWFSSLPSCQGTSWWPHISEWWRCQNSSDTLTLYPGHYILWDRQQETCPMLRQYPICHSNYVEK